MDLFSQVTDFLLFMGKLMITAGMCALAFYVFSEELQYEDYLEVQVPVLNYTIVPILIIGFGTYFIASIFFGVYSMAVDTIFLCFCKFYFYFIGMF
jgi:choline transporter-like protein 2/4/5